MSCEVVQCDCFEFVKKGLVFDHCITDPPYTSHVHSHMMSTTKDHKGIAVEPGFDSFDEQSIFLVIPSIKRWSLVFCALEQLGAYSASDLFVKSAIYHKRNPMPQLTGDRPGSSCEGIAVFHAKGRKRWNCHGKQGFWEASTERRKTTGHPTAKPVDLCLQIVKSFTDEGETVFDPFAGTGSIGIACKLLGRNYVGVEINEEYVRTANERIANASKYSRFL